MYLSVFFVKFSQIYFIKLHKKSIKTELAQLYYNIIDSGNFALYVSVSCVWSYIYPHFSRRVCGSQGRCYIWVNHNPSTRRENWIPLTNDYIIISFENVRKGDQGKVNERRNGLVLWFIAELSPKTLKESFSNRKISCLFYQKTNADRKYNNAWIINTYH